MILIIEQLNFKIMCTMCKIYCSTTLGSISNSPSACFVASDGESLRIYQAVIDGRALLAEISTAERKKRVMMESTMSVSSDSSLQEHQGQAVSSS